MSSLFLGVILFSVFGIIMLTSQGFAGSLDTTSEVNKVEGLLVSDETGKVLRRTDLGTDPGIDSVLLRFTTAYGDGTIEVTLKDNEGEVIGYGTEICSSCGIQNIVSLSNQVTAVERDTLKEVVVKTT